MSYNQAVSTFLGLLWGLHGTPVCKGFSPDWLDWWGLGEGCLYARWTGRGCSHLLRTLYCLGFGVRRAAIRLSLNYVAYIPMPELDGFPGTAGSEGRSRTLAQSPFPLRAETLGMWAKNWIKTINSHNYSASSPLPPPSVRLIWVAADQCALLALLVQERSEDTSPVARVSSLDSSRAQYGSLTGQYPDVVLGVASAEQPWIRDDDRCTQLRRHVGWFEFVVFHSATGEGQIISLANSCS